MSYCPKSTSERKDCGSGKETDPRKERGRGRTTHFGALIFILFYNFYALEAHIMYMYLTFSALFLISSGIGGGRGVEQGG